MSSGTEVPSSEDLSRKTVTTVSFDRLKAKFTLGTELFGSISSEVVIWHHWAKGVPIVKSTTLYEGSLG